jgi:hypothetical protein
MTNIRSIDMMFLDETGKVNRDMTIPLLSTARSEFHHQSGR